MEGQGIFSLCGPIVAITQAFIYISKSLGYLLLPWGRAGSKGPEYRLIRCYYDTNKVAS